jgi:hypothetical protein
MEVLQRTANRGSIATGGYDINNSLKFEEDNSEVIATTNQAAGDRKTWTFSAWVKRTEITYDYATIFGAEFTIIKFLGDDRLELALYNGTYYSLITTQKFRDTSAWYHIVAVCDTTQATASERSRLYVNGERVTVFDTSNSPPLNSEFAIGQAGSAGSGAWLRLGQFFAGSDYFNGYMAEVHYLNGTAAQASDFGEYDSDSGIWVPKEYTGGGYGTQGFYYKFDNSANLGEDSSGEGHDANSINNITSADQATDTPTNNGCTLNVLASLEGSNDITEGALVSTGKAGGGGNFNGTYGTIGIDPFNSSVDWYWEIETSIGTSGSDTDIGIGWIKESRITSGSTAYNNVYADGISRYSSQTVNAAGDIWGVLLETGTTPVMKLYRNDGLIYTATHGSGGVSFDTLMFPYITVKGTSVDARLNFLNPASSFSIASGNTDPNGYGNFEFDPKGGYALCTKNLAEYG